MPGGFHWSPSSIVAEAEFDIISNDPRTVTSEDDATLPVVEEAVGDTGLRNWFSTTRLLILSWRTFDRACHWRRSTLRPLPTATT